MFLFPRAKLTDPPPPPQTLSRDGSRWDEKGCDGHDEWFSASISSVPVKGCTSRNSKTARAWKGWYRVDFHGFVCDDPLDLGKYAKRERLRLGETQCPKPVKTA